MKKCNKCGNEQADGKFCGKCGEALPGTLDKESIEFISSDNLSEASSPGYLSWNTNAAQIALRIKESELETYGSGLKGFIVGPGQCALIYAGGKLVTELSSGTYDFPSRPENFMNEREGGVIGALSNVSLAVSNFIFGVPKDDKILQAMNENAEHQKEIFVEHLKLGKPFSIVIARTGSFDLNIIFEQVQTADLRSDFAALVRCKIEDYNSLYSEFLTDLENLTQPILQQDIISRVKGAVSDSLHNVKAEEVEFNIELKSNLLTALDISIGQMIKFLSIEKLTIKHEGVQRIREKQEELLLAEKELDQLVASNDFANRLQLEDNRRLLEEATTNNEFSQSMQVINKDGLLRNEDITNFERSIFERAEDHGISRAQALDLTNINHNLNLESKRRSFYREQEDEDNLADIHQVQRLQELNKLKKQNELELENVRKEFDHKLNIEKIDHLKDLDVDRIMLLNPEMDRETAVAMLEKQARIAEAQVQSEVSERELERSRESVEAMKDFMEKHEKNIVNLASGKESANEKELDRMQKSAEKTEERLSNVVSSTVGTFKSTPASKTKDPKPPSLDKELSFYVAVGNKNKGSFSISAIADQIATGKFDSKSKVWCTGMDDWKPADQTPEIRELLENTPPPILDN